MLDASSVPAPGTQCDVSAIVLTFNEAENIAACMRSLAWVDDCIIVDSGSTDETLAIAKSIRPDVRIFHNPFEDFGQQRNWALDNTSPRYAWILFLDADEESTPTFRDEVQRTLANSGDTVGYYLTYRNMFIGKWLKYSTFYPSWQLRLLRSGQVRYRREGHGQREVTEGPLGYIRQPYDHFPFRKGLAHWLARHNKYSSSECELVQRLRDEPLRGSDLLSRDALVRRRCLKRLAARIWFRPTIRFLYTYVFKWGILDGRPGYIYCRLIAQYEFQLWAKAIEAQHVAKTRDVNE